MMRHLPTSPYIEVEGDNARGTWYVFGMVTSLTPKGEAAIALYEKALDIFLVKTPTPAWQLKSIHHQSQAR